jgi:hypothetical protein
LQIAIYKNGQIAIYGQIIEILQIIKIPSIGNFCKFTKNGQIIAILHIAIYRNGQIIAICKFQL